MRTFRLFVVMIFSTVLRISSFQPHLKSHIRLKTIFPVSHSLLYSTGTNSVAPTSSTSTTSSTSKSAIANVIKKSPNLSPQFLFVGGKGGVGKTSTSSAIAISCSDAGLKTLIVSTDPAHSLGDALGVDLSNGEINTISTEDNLYALEVDVEKSMKEFRDIANGLNTENLAASLGVPKDIIDSLGLNDLASIFSNPPPGIDEIVALTNIFKYAKEKSSNGLPKFDRIIVDTAPTGHTLRLLQLPTFLNSITGKLIKFRSKLISTVDTFKSFFGGSNNSSSSSSSFFNTLSKLETLQTNLAGLKETLEDPSQTQFTVVTIPTTLAVAESERLVSSLMKQKVKMSSIVCNQIISPEYGPKYIETRRIAQRRCVNILYQDAEKYKASITEVPFVDTEVTGIYGLKYFSSIAHPSSFSISSTGKGLVNPIDSRKLTIFGGKGGVGKTSSAASWAIKLSDSGFRTLVVSTDPAHSLGDAFTERLYGLPRKLDESEEGGELWAMEIDPEQALLQFQEIIKTSMNNQTTTSSSSSIGGGFMSGLGLGQIKDDLVDILSGVNDPPPGTDEVVALTKIISYLEDGYEMDGGKRIKFDRIVLDTAPTGHTLRMLELPKFLIQLVRKLKSIKEKTGMLGNIMGGFSGSTSISSENTSSSTPDRLEKFENQMNKLESILHNSKESEFTIVTIPTDLAVAESQRLLSSLKESNVSVRRIIVNQVIPEQDHVEDDKASKSYLNRLRQGQKASIEKLEKLAASISVDMVKVPYFDMEVRTVYGLRALGNVILPPK